MTFEDELQQGLADSRQREAREKEGARLTAAAGQKALERFEKKCRDAAAFLAKHNVPTVPFIEEIMKKTFWSGEKKLEQIVARGWKLSHEFLAIAEDGTPWQSATSGFPSLAQSVPWDLDRMRSRVSSGQLPLKLPLGNLHVWTPRIIWNDARESFDGKEDNPIMIRTTYGDEYDLERQLAQDVIQLAKAQGR